MCCKNYMCHNFCTEVRKLQIFWIHDEAVSAAFSMALIAAVNTPTGKTKD